MGLNFPSGRFCRSTTSKTVAYPKDTPHQKLAPEDFDAGPFCAEDIYASGYLLHLSAC